MPHSSISGSVSSARAKSIFKRSSLQASALQFGHAVNNEIYPAQWAFRVSLTDSLDEIARQLRSGYRSWSNRTAHPEIIESIYWVDYDTNRDLHLYEFNSEHTTLSKIPWPDHLSGWYTYFIERTRRQLEYYQPLYSESIIEGDQGVSFLDLSAQLMVERPAIIIPVSIDSDIESANLLANLNATSSGRAGHTLITLNKSHLNDTFFPGLTDSLIYPMEEEVDVLIVSNSDSTKVIYRSQPDLSISHFQSTDARQQIGLFRWMPFTAASQIASGYATLLERDRLIADSLVEQMQRSQISSSIENYTPSSTTFTDYPVQAIIQLVEEEHYQGELTADHLMMALSRLSGNTGGLSTPYTTSGNVQTFNPTVATPIMPGCCFCNTNRVLLSRLYKTASGETCF